MPKKRQRSEGERFKCPYPGCKRSFAELWRLKVHYRAAPEVRGSGKERGHGQELRRCPLCDAALMPGKHHIQCLGSRGKAERVRPLFLARLRFCGMPLHPQSRPAMRCIIVLSGYVVVSQRACVFVRDAALIASDRLAQLLMCLNGRPSVGAAVQ